MTVPSSSVFVRLSVVFLVVLALGPSLWGGASSQTLYYLGRIADGYPPELIQRELGRARAQVVGIEDGLIIFGINPATTPTGLLKKLPFLKEVYTTPKEMRANASLREAKLAQRFLEMPGRETVLRQATASPVGPRPQASLAPAASLSPEMLALDQRLREMGRLTLKGRTSTAAPGPRLMVEDDMYEPNNDWASAWAVSPGGMGGLQCLDDDWFKVNLSAGQDILVIITFDRDYGDLIVEVTDSVGTGLTVSSTGRDFGRGYGSNMSAGYAYIHVVGYAGATKAYSMTITTGNVLGDVSGKVSNESASGIPNLWVYFYDPDYYYAGQAKTNATGNYAVGLPPDVYNIFFNGQDVGNYIPEWYNDKANHDLADDVTVAAGGSYTINAQLATGGIVSGLVTDSVTAAGVAGVYAYIYDLEYNYASSAPTNTDGTYSARGIPAGQYKVCFDTYALADYLSEWYNAKPAFPTADQVTVTKGLTTQNINATLDRAAKVSGLVTDASTTNPVAGATVHLWDLNGTYIKATTTGFDGTFLCGGFPQGSYKVRFTFDAQDYVPEWYSGVHDFDSATIVPATAGSTYGGVNAQLERGGGLQGRVRDDEGYDLSVIVKVFDPSGVEIGWGEAHGSYALSGIPVGPCRVYFDAAYDGNHSSEWYNDRMSFAQADPVQIVLGQPTTGIDAQLGNVCRVRGTVKNKRDVPLARVVVAAYDPSHQFVLSAQTGADGSYELSLKAGSYKIYFDPAYALGIHLPEWYNNKSSFEAADTVVVSGVEVRVNATLDAPTMIAVGSPAAGTTVYTGTSPNIVWTKNGAQAATVKIQLYKGSTMVKTIVSSTANDGSYPWPVATTTASATNYRIKITTTDNKVTGWSGTFSVAKPALTVTSPAGGVNWLKGSFHTITWTKFGPMSDFVNVQLFLGTTKKLDISLNAGNAGAVGWTIPTNLPASTNYWIKITTVDGKVTTKSAKFRIS